MPREIVIPLSLRSAEPMTVLKSKQHGFALFELILAIALASLIAMWAATVWMRQVDDALAHSMGVWLHSVQKGMNQMLRRQSDFMSGMTQDLMGASQYASLHSPTIPELILAGHLPKGFAIKPPLAYQVSIHVASPEGDCAMMGCRIEALIYAQPALSEVSRATDITRIGKILLAMQGEGASVHPIRPDRIQGPGVDIANQVEGQSIPLPAGSIVAKSFYDSSHLAHLVRREDRRDTALEGQLNVRKGIFSDADIHTKAGLHAKGRITAGEYLQLAGRASAGQACQSEGLIGYGSQGDLLTCHAGSWRSHGGRFGGVFSWHSFHGCGVVAFGPDMSNPYTGGCSCPEGFSQVQISRWKDEVTELGDFRTYICLR